MARIGDLEIAVNGRDVEIHFLWANGRDPETWAGDLDGLRLLVRAGWPSLRPFLPADDHAALMAQLRDTLRKIESGDA